MRYAKPTRHKSMLCRIRRPVHRGIPNDVIFSQLPFLIPAVAPLAHQEAQCLSAWAWGFSRMRWGLVADVSRSRCHPCLYSAYYADHGCGRYSHGRVCGHGCVSFHHYCRLACFCLVWRLRSRYLSRSRKKRSLSQRMIRHLTNLLPWVDGRCSTLFPSGGLCQRHIIC